MMAERRPGPRDADLGTATETLEVPAEAAGMRLDRFLAAPVGSRAHAQRLIDARRVRVDGRPRPKRHLVAAGELVEVDPIQGEEPGPPQAQDSAPFAVAYEDDHLLIVTKPAGVVVHPARGHTSGTLTQALALRGVGGGGSRAGLVHRLDRDTSGLLVVAKRDDVHRALRAMLAERRISREYLTLVAGHPPARTATIEAPIGRHRRERIRMSIDTDKPRDALTHFSIERLMPSTTLLRVRLVTGRTHQIRVHLAAIGHPVCGDPQYGRSPRFGLSRQFLHAERLSFEHPVTGEPVDARSPLPDDLVAALGRAESESEI